jgi:CubicO group peptidase (beta-lactamase class C family)
MKAGNLWLTVLLCALVYLPATAQNSKGTTVKFSEYLKLAQQNDQFTGTVLIAKEGKKQFQTAIGMADLNWNIKNTPTTKYLLASVTKQFTALAILQLEEQGKIQVSDNICRYLDNCPGAWKEITIHQVLTHSSGIQNISSLPEWDEQLAPLPLSKDSVVSLVYKLPLLFAPGTKYSYSSSGYFLLGLLIEKVSGKTYEEFLAENIFRPLNMNATGNINSRAVIPNMARGYYWAMNRFVNAYNEHFVSGFACGNLYSTADDLLKWDQALYTNSLVSKTTFEKMMTPYINNYGYGWNVRRLLNRNAQFHSGSSVGFSTFILRIPEDKLTIIVLSNSDETSASRVAMDLGAIWFGLPYSNPQPKALTRLVDAYSANGITGIKAAYEKIIKEKTYKEEEKEDMLNDIGYELLYNQQEQDAINLFTFYAALFPNSANAYDCLGEAYLMNKKYTEANTNYEKSLGLDPENSNAKKKMEFIKGKVLPGFVF